MKSFDRLASCTNCGSVNLKIKTGVGIISYYCAECNSKVRNVEFYKFETAHPICDKCGSDIFKVLITGNIENEFWQAKCINCDSDPKIVFVDYEGNLLETKEQVDLFFKDKGMN